MILDGLIPAQLLLLEMGDVQQFTSICLHSILHKCCFSQYRLGSGLTWSCCFTLNANNVGYELTFGNLLISESAALLDLSDLFESLDVCRPVYRIYWLVRPYFGVWAARQATLIMGPNMVDCDIPVTISGRERFVIGFLVTGHVQIDVLPVLRVKASSCIIYTLYLTV
jgi:hypothetical protein